MPATASFYEITRQRDQAMIENAMGRVGEFNVPFAVLIAGGFHTPEFTRLLKERQISYAVIAPKIGRTTGDRDLKRAHQVALETYQPMSKEYRRKAQESMQAGSDQ